MCMQNPLKLTLILILCAPHDDVVDWDEHELNGVADEAHDGKADCATGCDLSELLGVGLGASLEQSARAVGKLLSFLHVFH